MSSAGKRNFIETAPVGKRRPREKAGNARQINEKKQSVEAARITAASAPAGKAAPADGGRGDMAGTADREGSEAAAGTTDRAARPGPSLRPGRSGIQACFDLLFESTAFYSKRTGLLPRLQARPVNSARVKGAPAPLVRLTIADEAPGRKTTGRMRSLYFAGVLYSTRTRASGKPSGRFLRHREIFCVVDMAVRVDMLPQYGKSGEPFPGRVGQAVRPASSESVCFQFSTKPPGRKAPPLLR